MAANEIQILYWNTYAQLKRNSVKQQQANSEDRQNILIGTKICPRQKSNMYDATAIDAYKTRKHKHFNVIYEFHEQPKQKSF